MMRISVHFRVHFRVLSIHARRGRFGSHPHAASQSGLSPPCPYGFAFKRIGMAVCKRPLRLFARVGNSPALRCVLARLWSGRGHSAVACPSLRCVCPALLRLWVAPHNSLHSLRSFRSDKRGESVIGIGAGHCRPDPSHTTRHAGPHRAVREVEVRRTWELPGGRSEQRSAPGWQRRRWCATNGVRRRQ